jgi:hypothetical protein
MHARTCNQPAATQAPCHCRVVGEEPVHRDDGLSTRDGVAAWLERRNSETEPRSDQVGSSFLITNTLGGGTAPPR